MPETSKYNFFMEELSSLEKRIYSFIQRDIELSEENIRLVKRVEQLENENEVLILKIREVEEKVVKFQRSEIDANDSLGSEEKEKIKTKIDDLISKIDYHLRS
ncbi:MAG: hypothetical protein KKA84_00955 [Bacteroidetes bacterium]|nr:hypothetical protein [Bacteroidota bacterium]